METPWSITFDETLYNELTAHLFQEDRDEHGAVITAGVVKTARGTRLLVRECHIARDGIDFVPSPIGHRMLTAEFVNRMIRHCRDENLAFLAVHNHGGRDYVEFSPVDNASHERGYPALLDIANGPPVGALVLTRNAVAGDIWSADRTRRTIRETIVLGPNIQRLHPEPPPRPKKADVSYDRHVRFLGDRGQELLGSLKVGVIGSGGVGTVLVGLLSRLGVGELVVVEPERIEPTNLPRLPESRRIHALTFLRRGERLAALADRLSLRKITLARRIATRANRKIRFNGIATNVIEPAAAHQLVDCDFLFLAADSHQARMVFNAICHQYLIPGFDLGTRIEVDPDTGEVGEIRTNIRLVLPRAGCLRCNNLISGEKLQEESLPKAERDRNRYIDEIPAPSVISFNTLAAAQAVTDFLLMMGNLMDESASTDYLLFRPRRRRHEPLVPQTASAGCRDCGTTNRSRRARGDSVELPLPER